MAGTDDPIGPDRISRQIGEPVFAVADGEVVFANLRFLEITASDREEVVGSDAEWVEQFVGAGLEALQGAVQAVDAGDSAEARVELSMRHPEESSSPPRLPAEARVTPLGDDGDGVVVALRNIADRVEREQELRELTDEYEAVLENSEDGVFLVDVEHTGAGPEFRFERLNPAHEAISGMRTERVRGKTPREALGDETGAAVAENYRRCVEAGETIRYEEALSMPSGSIVWETKLTPVFVDGEVSRIVGVARDVTERVEQERALERQRDRLEEFAGVVSHDLRNPLNVARGRLELAREECDSDHLDSVARAHERMDELIEDLLALARAGESVSDVGPVDLAGVAERSWQDVQTKEASLAVEAETALRADESRLRQLLENLLRNAVEHGGEAVSVTVGDLEEVDGFFVEDDGTGIPEDERERVFESGVSLAEGGSGFGLSIVRGVAEAHGWEVDAGDGAAGGARFEVSDVEPVE